MTLYYRHHKEGVIYELLCESGHTERAERLACYRRVWPTAEERVWSRPWDMFHETLPSGRRRFELVTDVETLSLLAVSTRPRERHHRALLERCVEHLLENVSPTNRPQLLVVPTVAALEAMRRACRDSVVAWSQKEQDAIFGLMESQGLSEGQVLRQALRHYQLIVERTSAGETCSWSGDETRTREKRGGDGPW